MEKVKRYTKEELLSCIDTMGKVNDMLMHENTRSQLNLADTLVQCQELAIMLGNFLETLGEVATKFVKHLENYCEYIFGISQAGSVEEMQSFLHLIEAELKALKIEIEYDLPVLKKEVVFLPYKASMWDSLESVWKKYDEDESVDAYVIPIPYYDKNNDGTLGEMHYEGDLYPKDVPIINYEEYDFEGRHPDEIYIHNPYDDYNFVTSVDPRFYSSVLKEYTEKLVYIPYFVIQEINPYDEVERKSIAHYVVVPGVLHSHKIIVQSERMKQAYIEIMCAEMGDTPQVRRYWEDKIDGSGSPKLNKDKIVRELDIPEQWNDLLRKPDGTNKKVVFYNTTVNILLKQGEKLLNKMQSVFEIFAEYQEDYVLLWRPHPLMEGTLKSMRPELLIKYLEIKNSYIENRIGIFDDTADLDRSITISDIYYGDSSSVMHLFKNVGKDVVLQSYGLINLLDSNTLERVVELDGVTYGLNSGGVLFKKESDSNSYCIETIISPKVEEWYYRDMIAYDHKLIFPPYFADEFIIYDPRTKKKQYITTELLYMKYFFGSQIIQNNLYLFPTVTAGHVAKIDLDTFEIIDFNSILPAPVLGYGDANCCVGEWIYVPSDQPGTIIAINGISNETKLVKIDGEHLIHQIRAYQNTLICVADSDCVFFYDILSHQTKKYSIEIPGYQIHKTEYWLESFIQVIIYQGYIYYMPLAANMLLRQSVEGGDFQFIAECGENGFICREYNAKRMVIQKIHSTDEQYDRMFYLEQFQTQPSIREKEEYRKEEEILIQDIIPILLELSN